MNKIQNRIFALFFLVCMLIVRVFPGAAEETKNILTVEAAVQEALKNNTLIRRAIEEERAAVEGEKSARAELLPRLSASYSYNRLHDTPYAVFNSIKVDAGEKDNIFWDVTVSQPLFTGFALTTKRKIAALEIDLQEILKQQAVLDVVMQTRIACFQVLLARSALEVANEEERQLGGHAHDAKKIYGQGLVPYNDLLKSQVALAQARQNRVSAASKLRIAVSSLNTILRRDIMEKTQVRKILSFRPSHYEIPALFEEAIRKRPELRQLNVVLEQAGLSIRIAKSSYYPQVYLVGSYEQTGDNLSADNNDFGNDHNSIVGFHVIWPFFEWGKTRAEATKALHKKAALEQKIQEVKDSILLEVTDAFQRLGVSEKNIQTARDALVQAKENFRITNLQYRDGITTSTEVLDARTFLTQAEMNHHNTIYGYRIAEAELKRAVGKK